MLLQAFLCSPPNHVRQHWTDGERGEIQDEANIQDQLDAGAFLRVNGQYHHLIQEHTQDQEEIASVRLCMNELLASDPFAYLVGCDRFLQHALEIGVTVHVRE